MYDKLRRDIRISKGYTDSNNWVPDWACGMKKVLYVNGCSHTHGTELAMDNRLDLTWPHLLTNYLVFDLINDSECGSSNDRIFRTTIEYILSTPTPPEKVVIQFTEPDRIEIIEKTFNPRSPILDEKYKYFAKEYFDVSNIIDIKFSRKLLNQIYALEVLLKEYAINDYIFLVWRPVDINYITYKHIDKIKIMFNVSHKLHQKYEICKTLDPKRNNTPDITELGLIAQDIESAGIPHTIIETGHSGKEIKSVNQMGLIATLVNATKELKTKIDSLEARLTALES
jgi:hypothetical protein